MTRTEACRAEKLLSPHAERSEIFGRTDSEGNITGYCVSAKLVTRNLRIVHHFFDSIEDVELWIAGYA